MTPATPAAYPVELTPPDITAYAAGNTGIPYVWTFDSGQPGPHVAVTAVVHGNEPCGAIALDWLFGNNVRPVQGRLSLAFINIAAYEAFDAANPNASRWVDEDFNRLWSPGVLDDPDRKLTVELARAREIRPWLDTVDLLLDIHSMQHKTEPLTIAGPLAKGRDLARAVGTPAVAVSDHGHDEGVRMRDYADFANPASGRNALLVECGQHWETPAADIALDTTLAFLAATGAVPQDFVAAHRPLPVPENMRFYEVSGPVTIQTDNFRFAEDWRGFEHLPQGALIGHDGAREIRAPHATTVLIMPSARLWPGKTAVRLAQPVDVA
ncbi:succinylglutamate desuccinylase/aspartoacylase domain-containing protein [Roseinatronobacter alkalisoli]|uniref:Succinylglutamate desuccinylase/aspartoacylase family protein n=1 Tax=Roseinatronobacter alkalisoli TaxID=3028235 RepID=A0ABT5TAZ2_9RHOB|nr:succinylglutamate desuccinylase/aspartoacylase family protein [Roseinatronobacter sp. HJB301]MDD7972249.1 succinylglutamate desuccinylase/aspartoacylase family protein [Roseinatronobacter sp. HJB301]